MLDVTKCASCGKSKFDAWVPKKVYVDYEKGTCYLLEASTTHVDVGTPMFCTFCGARFIAPESKVFNHD